MVLLRKTYQLFFNNSILGIVFVVSLLFFWIKSEKNRKEKEVVGIVTIILFCIIWNPIFYTIMEKTGQSEYRWVRIYWLLFINVIIGIAITELMTMIKSGKQKIMLGIFLLILIGGVFGENRMINKDNYSSTENLYKIPQNIIDISDYIKQDAEKNERNISAIMPQELSTYIKMYDGEICLPYARLVFGEEAVFISEVLSSDVIDTVVLADVAKRRQYQYIVVHEEKTLSEPFENNGYVYLDSVDGYCIYRCKEEKSE